MSAFHTYFQEPQEDSSIIYTFYSDLNKRIYKINFDPTTYSEFAEAFPALLSEGHVIGIYNKIAVTGQEMKEDKNVEDTIVEIISSYLQGLPQRAVLLYHCDSSDDKQSYRNTLFESWLSRPDVKDKITKEVIEVDVPVGETTTKHYLGYITLNDNPNAAQINEEFNVFCYFMLD